MGVQGLWQLLHPAGQPVSPASLEGKVLAVDVSIWLHQTMKGMRDKDGNPLPNAHLQGLFSRVCKLLFYRIKPVFVFDGGVPDLKKQTLAIRRERKENIDREKGQTNQKLLRNLLRSRAVQELTGEGTNAFSVPARPGTEPDLFHLPPLPEVDKGTLDSGETFASWEAEANEAGDYSHLFPSAYQADVQNLEDVDFDSEEFQSLPSEIQHEILTEMKEQRREYALARIAVMPEESEEFSDYQLKKLIKQSRLTGRIDSVRKEMNQKMSGDISYALGDDYYGEVVEARRVVSEDAAHYVLIKGLTRRQQMAEAERCRERRLRRDLQNMGTDAKSAQTLTEVDVQKDTADTDGAAVAMETEEGGTKTGSVADNKHSDHSDSGEEGRRKRTKRERRGKGLLTKNGVRSAAKGGKGKKRRLNIIVSDNEEEEMVEEMGGDNVAAVSGSVPSKSGSHSVDTGPPRTNSVSNDPETIPTNESHSSVVYTLDKKCESGCRQSTLDNKDCISASNNLQMSSALRGNSEGSATSLTDIDRKVEESVKLTKLHEGSGILEIDKKVEPDKLTKSHEGSGISTKSTKTLYSDGIEAGDSSLKEENSFQEMREKLLSEEERLLKEKENKMVELMKSLEKRTRQMESLAPTVQKVKSSVSGERTHVSSNGEVLKQNHSTHTQFTSVAASGIEQTKSGSPTRTETELKSDTLTFSGHSVKNQNLKSCSKEKTSMDESQKSSFLSDVSRMDSKSFPRRSSRSKASHQTLSTNASQSSARSSSVPALTADYLEDVDSMLEMTSNSDRNVSCHYGMVEECKINKDTSKLTGCDSLTESATKSGVEARVGVVMPGERDFQSGKETARQSSFRAGFSPQETKERSEVKVAEEERSAQGEEEDSEDEGFIEITIDPSKAAADDLFPASIFATATPTLPSPGSPNQAGKERNQGAPARAITDNILPMNDAKVQSQENIDMPTKQSRDLEKTLVQGTDKEFESLRHDENGISLSSKESKKHEKLISDDNVPIPLSSKESEDCDKDEQDEKMSVTEPDICEESREEEAILVRQSSEEWDKLSLSGISERGLMEEGERGGNAEKEREKDEEERAFSKGVNSLSDLYELQRGLAAERHSLTSQRGRQARLGRSITEQINLEAQELLQLFGLPYVVSPKEAESQCAHLELLGLTQGTITDDSDAWLFGASAVYKNFFNNAKYVEFYSADTVLRKLGLRRRQLINLALLCGSDYTPGIPGVGPVRGMEILAEFPGDQLEGLQAFREWWEDVRDGVLPSNQGRVRSKLKTLQLHDGFPSSRVVQAYLNPEVDQSEESFTWGMPDLELLRQFASKKFGWSREKADQTLEPMMKELTKKSSQGRIHSYFQPENFMPPKPVKSKRLQKALDKFQGQTDSSESDSTADSESDDSESSDSESDKKLSRVHLQSGKGRGRGHQLRKNEGPGFGGKNDVQESRGKGRGRGVGRARSQDTNEKGQRSATEQVGKGQGHLPSKTKGIQNEKVKRAKQSKSASSAGRTGGGRGRGKRSDNQEKSAAPKRVLHPSEMALSESSSSCEDDEEPPPKKHKVQLSRKPGSKSGKPGSLPKPSNQKTASRVIKRCVPGPNVKQVNLTQSVPAFVKSMAIQQKEERKRVAAAAKILPNTDEVTAFKAALGDDLDPSTMTLDDLGSDFSEEEGL